MSTPHQSDSTRPAAADRDRAVVRSLVRWFRANARDLPWRERPLGSPRDPYRVLVSELMLQQTQASRVTERFEAFIHRFPTVEALARASEPDVLALWSGLGYYRRARLLHAAAQEVINRHAGRFPRAADRLASLPGLGRYTAGAVASLAFLERTPAVDANVARVMLRLEGRELASQHPDAVTLAWSRAAALHASAPRARATPSLLNEALIEFGALICTPRAPRCTECPVRDHCRALAEGSQGRIPTPKTPAARKPLFFASVIVRDRRGRIAVVRRPQSGLWAGLHEAPTVERNDRHPTPAEIRRSLGLPTGRGTLARVASFQVHTSHRDCAFEVFRGGCPARPPASWRFLGPSDVAGLGLSTPQRRILLELARADT
ncbi:MAG: A/G-specific adenine glycosylase [Phycisphaerales bacterium JB041]